MNLALLLGLASALCYGITDYLARIAGRAIGVWRSVFYGDLAAFFVLSAWFAHGSGATRVFTSHLAAWIASLIAGVVLLAAAALLTRGLTRGTLAVVAPVTASYGAIAALLSAATGERLSLEAGWGIVFTVCGVCLVSLPARGRRGTGRRMFQEHLHASGFGWALGAAVCYAVGFWLQGAFAVPALGPFIPVWLSYGIVVTVIPMLMPVLGARLAPPRRGQWGAVLGAGLFSAAAYAALAIGQSTGRVAIVVVLSSLASAVTVLLSRLIDRAAIALHQWLAMGVIVAGLILING
jgi:drug/metabolite transporter (DMT)-like permease